MAYVFPNIKELIRSGKDPSDRYTKAIPFDNIPDYIGTCQEDGLEGTHIGVPRLSIIEKSGEHEAIHAFNSSLDLLRSLGAETVEHADYLHYEDNIWTKDARIVYVKVKPHGIANLDDLVRYTKETPEAGYPSRDAAYWEESAGIPYEDNTSEYFKKVYERHVRTSTTGSIVGAIERYQLDTLVTLTDYDNHPAGPAGLPLVSVPLAFDSCDANIVLGRGGLRDKVAQSPCVIPASRSSKTVQLGET